MTCEGSLHFRDGPVTDEPSQSDGALFEAQADGSLVAGIRRISRCPAAKVEQHDTQASRGPVAGHRLLDRCHGEGPRRIWDTAKAGPPRDVRNTLDTVGRRLLMGEVSIVHRQPSIPTPPHPRGF